MSSKNRDYVDVIYNEKDRPLTNYPNKLAKYLFDRYEMQSGQKFLDVGCGRGEFLSGFISCGIKGYGVDRSNSAEHYCPEANLSIVDLEKDSLPFENNYFDVVYSKSVIEHFHYPEKLVQEIYRVLKPGGIVITLCPSWEYNYRNYFDDFTHRTPFMLSSLRDIFRINGFDKVKTEFFRQLPYVWKWPWLMLFSELTRFLVPTSFKLHFKWVRFSKEIMLLSTAIKPIRDRDE
jgi:SAM-dependent methyltransferase